MPPNRIMMDKTTSISMSVKADRSWVAVLRAFIYPEDRFRTHTQTGPKTESVQLNRFRKSPCHGMALCVIAKPCW